MKEKIRLPSLIFCVLLDLTGMASYALPGLGEFADLIWAPVSALLFYKMFGGRFGLTGAVLNFIEESLPATDVIPSFTIAWMIRYFQQHKLANAGRSL